MIGIPLGFLVSNAAEWVIHKHVLHGIGKKKGSFWHFHWNEHHRAVRKHDHRDPDYERSIFGWHAQSKEALLVAGAALAHTPLLPIAPFYVGTIWYCALEYYQKHKRSHLDIEWAREHLPWHYDHHMGPNQDANWCVTRPWFDHVMGTREPYVGTEREEKDRARKAEKRRRKAARAAKSASASQPRGEREPAPQPLSAAAGAASATA